ncbi:aryl-sulfate sulfotransferase [Bacteroidia bacterium]|nr:aryl-sulfate sulfotransferase [Bacteroidia bacterium]
MIKNILRTILVFLIGLNLTAQSFNGYVLYNPQNSQTTYLVDKDYNIAHTWSCNVNGNYTVFLKEDGNLLRQGVASGAQINGAAAGGIIQELDKNANVVWEFTYSAATYRSHHDFAVLPNGNVLLTAWETKTVAELAAAGYSGTSAKWPTHIVEVQRDGTGGKIVWEWHMWDHMIQDTDAGKPNYGVVKDHPELMNINVPSSARSGGPGGGGGDWFHVNGIDYNDSLDQIVFTTRYMSEVIIIDHSTTTAEAATHSGGKSGKGGDFLFRYGNPANYGSSASKVVAGAVHDPRWIKEGRPNAGYIQFFNNVGGTNGSSVVQAINPKMELDGYNYTFSNGSFSPTSHNWQHQCKSNADGQSASDRMTNGNTFVNLSRNYMYEVNSNDSIVWQYNEGPAKAFRYECEYPGIIALLNDPCNITSINQLIKAPIGITPNPSQGHFRITGIDQTSSVDVSIYNLFGQEVLHSVGKTEINNSNLPSGTYLVKVFTGQKAYYQKLVLLK